MERLQKIVAKAGIASRRRAEQMILEGRVQVNGVVETVLGTKADPVQDFIKVDGKRILPEQTQVYVLLNKPKGYITSLKDPEGRPTVMDLVSDIKARICPVGRLDYETEGLLLLTNDGDLANALMHPRLQIEKTYWTKVKGHFTEKELKRMTRGGMSLPTGKTEPCRARVLRKTTQNEWIELVLHEGKKREIRLMMAQLGHPVIKLKRVAYSYLKIRNLSLGRYRHLTANEVEKLHVIVGGQIATGVQSGGRPPTGVRRGKRFK
ncbi:rRNA pseudouridine synthase [Nitrospira defluvii]|nr:rRNA pseudouridine synthase [Nitrospira defluvii]